MAKTNEYIGEAYHTFLELNADEEKRFVYRIKVRRMAWENN